MMALNGRFTSATSNWTLSVQKFSSVPNVTDRVMLPRGNSGEWARGSQLGLRDLQLLERCIADEVEAGTTVNQHVIEPDVGYDRGRD